MLTRLSAWAAGHAHATSILSREAARTSRQWQTYAARASFSGVLLGLLLALMWLVVRGPFMDKADLGWLGRGMFVFFTIIQQLLIFGLAPILSAQAMNEEMDDRTLDILALTRLRPNEILVGKVLSRMFVLTMISFGALPVVSVIASLGGVSVYEVLATTAHHLATIALLSFLGGFYALFTRNAILATLAACSTAGALFTLPPLVYGALVMDPLDGVHLSPLLGSSAIDGWALLPVVAQLPVIALIVRLSTRLFDLHLARAGAMKRFGAEAWGAHRWASELLVVGLGTVVAIPAAMVCWGLQLAGSGGPVASAVHVGAQGYLWLWMVAASTVATWPMLRLSADIIEGLDRMVGRSRTAVERRGAIDVWSNPVAWYEGRPHKWSRVAVPMLFIAILAVFMLMQSMVFIIPGALVFTGMVVTGSAVGATVWMVTRSVASDRRDGTLEVLLTSPLSSLSIVLGKLTGAVAAGLPLLLFSCPFYIVGIWYVDLFFPDDYALFTGVRGTAVWLWTLPAWLALVSLALAVTLRTNNLRSAFVSTLALATFWLLGAAIFGRLWADTPWIGIPMRVLAPPMAGSNSAIEYGLGCLWLLAASAALLAGISWRLRRWLVPMVALLMVLPAAAAELELQAAPVGDGLARAEQWLPIQVEVVNPGPATTGTVSWVTGGGTPVSYRRGVDLPEGARKSITLLIRPGQTVGKPRVVLATADGRERAVEVALRSVATSDVTIGVLGDDPVGLNGLTSTSLASPPGRLPRAAAEAPRGVRTGLVALAAAPLHASGWAAFDQVVWYRADPTRLDPRQLEALHGWVADGGHLTLVVTDTAPAVRASSLATWLPAALGPLRDLPDLDPLLAALGQAPAGPVAVASPLATAAPGAWVRAAAADGPLWLVHRYGLGTVTLLLADPRVAPLSAVPRPALWRAILSLPEEGLASLPDGLATVLHAEAPPLHCALVQASSWQDPVEEWSNPVRSYLNDIPGVAPVPLSWLVGFSTVYLLIIGPLDWWILRRLRREPLTWVTYPLTIAVFSAVALIGTSWSKGSQAIVRRLELVDAMPGTGLWRGTTFLAVFSTRKTDVSLTGGFDDSVIVPLENPGFANEPAVEVGDGPGRYTWKAETWTLAYARSAWVAPALGEVRASATPDGGFVVSNGLATPIGPVWVQRGGVRVASLDAVPAGETRTLGDPSVDLPTDLNGIADRLEETLDLGHGHLEAAQSWATVLAVLPAPVERVTLTGLTPVEQGATVLRIPIFATGARAASLSSSFRVTEGTLRDGALREVLDRLASSCFEPQSLTEDRTIVVSFAIENGTIQAPEVADPLASCVSGVLDDVWVNTETTSVNVALTLSWTGRQPGSPE